MAGVAERKDHTGRFFLILIGAVVLVPGLLYWTLKKTMDLGTPPSRMPERSIVFIGSSTIARFPLEKHFPGKGCVNLGVADEDAIAQLARLPTDLPDGSAPKAIVLYAGSYDLRFGKGLPPGEVRRRVADVVGDLRARFPAAPLALIEVLPGRAASDAERAALAELNHGLAALAREKRLAFVRTNRPPLADASGDLPEALSVDRFHLNDEGYRVLAQWIREDSGAVGDLLRRPE